MADWLIMPEGSLGQDRAAQHTIPLLDITAHTTLRDLGVTGRFFTHAATHTWLPHPCDPLADLLARRADIGVRLLVSPKAFFSGLGRPHAPHWDHVIFWVPVEHCPLVAAHLTASVFVGGGVTYRTYWEVGTIPDQLALAQAALLPREPRVDISVLCLNAPTWRMTLCTPDGVTAPLIVRKHHADSDPPARPVRG